MQSVEQISFAHSLWKIISYKMGQYTRVGWICMLRIKLSSLQWDSTVVISIAIQNEYICSFLCDNMDSDWITKEFRCYLDMASVGGRSAGSYRWFRRSRHVLGLQQVCSTSKVDFVVLCT